MKQPQVTVTASGPTGNDARVILADGSTLDNVIGATIFLNAGEMVRVDLEVLMPVVAVKDAIVNEVTFLCRCCNDIVLHKCGGDTFLNKP